MLGLALAAMVAGAQTDRDTVCATLYSYLGESARLAGMSAAFFDGAAVTAETEHLARNPAEDRARYAQEVSDGVAIIRDGLARGAITSATVMTTATACNGRYFSTAAPGDEAVTR
jgi:hypothetical protein